MNALGPPEPTSSLPTLIGYFPRRALKRPDWLKAPAVEEICSVSACISKVPDGWMDHWRHNEWLLYDDAASAWSVVPEEDRREFDLYAYRIFPLEFDGGVRRPFEVPPRIVEPIPVSFERLGYDVVSRHMGNDFEHSPLSCNGMGERIAVNRHCLVDDAETAFRLAAEFEKEGCEPGPYYVVEVWRQK